MSQTRRSLYHLARTLGDVEAAGKGPTTYGKRLARKAVYRRSGGATRRILRRLGL